MITLKEALEIYKSNYPQYRIESVWDVGDEWTFSALDAKTGYELDISPIAISKETGEQRVFFPPMNAEKLKNAKIVDLSDLEE